MIFTSAIEWAATRGYQDGVTWEALRQLRGEQRADYGLFLEEHMRLMELVLRETTPENEKHWQDVIFAELIKHAVGLKHLQWHAGPRIAPIARQAAKVST